MEPGPIPESEGYSISTALSAVIADDTKQQLNSAIED